MPKTYLIAAVEKNFGIGINNTLPWNIPEDLQFFQNTTTQTKNPELQNSIIMGRKTWESLPEKHRPLKNRHNIILTRDTTYQAPGAETTTTIEDALKLAQQKNSESIFIIGGGTIYNETINHPAITGVYLTHIDSEFECDTFFPALPDNFSKKQNLGEGEHNSLKYRFILHTP